MSQSQENLWTEGQKDRKTEGWKDRKTEGQNLIHRTLPVTAGGPINICQGQNIMPLQKKIVRRIN